MGRVEQTVAAFVSVFFVAYAAIELNLVSQDTEFLLKDCGLPLLAVASCVYVKPPTESPEFYFRTAGAIFLAMLVRALNNDSNMAPYLMVGGAISCFSTHPVVIMLGVTASILLATHTSPLQDALYSGADSDLTRNVCFLLLPICALASLAENGIHLHEQFARMMLR